MLILVVTYIVDWNSFIQVGFFVPRVFVVFKGSC